MKKESTYRSIPVQLYVRGHHGWALLWSSPPAASPDGIPLCLPKWAPSERRSGRGRGQLAVRVRASPRCRGKGRGAPVAHQRRLCRPRGPAACRWLLCPFAPLGRAGAVCSGLARMGRTVGHFAVIIGGLGPQKISIKIILIYNLSRNARYIVRSISRKL